MNRTAMCKIGKYKQNIQPFNKQFKRKDSIKNKMASKENSF